MTDAPLHLTPEELDLLLDESLPPARTSHLATCEECRLALEETRELVEQLRQLPQEVPSVRFADKVLAGMERGAVAAGHLSGEDLELWVTGELPATREHHLRSCPDCQALANQERLLVLQLERLPLFDPAPGFIERVLDRVDVPVTSAAGAVALWRSRIERHPVAVALATGAAVMLGGSVAASAAWASGNQELITGAGRWLLANGEQWFWVGVGTIEAQAWYQALRSVITPGRAVAAVAGITALYAAGIVTLRRLIALPQGQVARATH